MKKILATAALMIAVSTSAFAGTYGEVGAGAVGLAIGDTTLKHGAVRGIVGVDLTPNVAVEGHLVVGTSSDDIGSAKIKLQGGVGAFVKGSAKVTQDIGVFARVGYVRNDWSLDGVNGHNDGAAYGVGANYAVSKNGSVTLDYTQLYNKGGARLGTVMAGYNFKF